MIEPEPEISIKDLAKEWTTSEAYIRKLVKEGKLVRTRRGYVTYSSAHRVKKLKHPARVQQQRVARLTGGNKLGRGGKVSNNRKTAPEAPESEEKALEDEDAATVGNFQVIEGGAADEKSFHDQIDDALVRARAKEAIFRARDRELAFNIKAGTLVKRDDVKHEASNVARMVVQRLRSFPVRLAGQVVPLTDHGETVKVIEEECKRLIEELQEAMSEI